MRKKQKLAAYDYVQVKVKGILESLQMASRFQKRALVCSVRPQTETDVKEKVTQRQVSPKQTAQIFLPHCPGFMCHDLFTFKALPSHPRFNSESPFLRRKRKLEFNILETFPLHLQTLADSNEGLWGNVIFVRQAAQVERRAIGMRKKSNLVSVELWLKHAITFMALRPAVVAIVYDFCTAPPHTHTYTGVVVSLRLARSKSLSLRLEGEGRPRVGVGHQRCLSAAAPWCLPPSPQVALQVRQIRTAGGWRRGAGAG